MSDSQLDRVRRVCRALEGATEKKAWGEPTFRVKNRLFAMFASATNHHGAGREALWCYAPAGVQPRLVEAAPDRIFVPPYMGTKGWIGLWLDRVSDEELEVHVGIAHRGIAER